MKSILIVLISAILLAGCSKNEEAFLEDAIIVYNNSNTSSPGNIADSLIKSLSHQVLPKISYKQQGQCLYSTNDDSIKIVLPFEAVYSTRKIDQVMISCSEDTGLAISTGNDIVIQNRKGEPFLNFAIDDVKDKIKSLIVMDNYVYYYRKHKLYRMPVADKDSDVDVVEGKVFVEETFKPPYKKYYTVTLLNADDTIGVIVGSAGYYYISAVSISQKRTKVTNITASSSEVSFHRDHVYYVFGGSGNWHVKRFDYMTKRKQEIRGFRGLKIIKFFSKGFIFKDEHGIWLQDYNKDIIRVPFEYEVAGKYQDMLLLGYKNKVYLMDITELKNKLEELKLRLPELFT